MLQELFLIAIPRNLHEGDEVIVTGYDMGMNTPGGFGEYHQCTSRMGCQKAS